MYEEIKKAVLNSFKKYSTELNIYKMFFVTKTVYLIIAGPGNDIENDYNSNYYLTDLATNKTVCVPDAPYNPKYTDVFSTLREREI